uniref:Uncharacterized protein n=1 Tax=Ditylum brightwellii TaxID=49249 RepID=A0A7S1Z6L1_9STRA|mmetsp:Transcript_2516/g.3920  ORF Transcript_2516/g.3920 Transcript_2516/m.3920 type:complete len:262 (+) Transcript_2516:110-895(+)
MELPVVVEEEDEINNSKEILRTPRNNKSNAPFKSSSSPMMAAASKLSPQMELRLRLLPRIVSYRKNAWISAEQEHEFLTQLSDTKYNNDNTKEATDAAAKKVKRALDDIENTRQQRDGNYPATISKKLILPEKDTNEVVTTSSPSTTFLTPQHSSLSTSTMAQIFVETCFFARLGFYQPPTCLKCAHATSVPKKSPPKKCNRLILWRKNATIPLHPTTLEDNIVFIQCHVAHLLLKGACVDGVVWDKRCKRLLSSSLSSKW